MLVDIKNERVGIDSRPIFFVGHSLGGLVIKQVSKSDCNLKMRIKKS